MLGALSRFVCIPTPISPGPSADGARPHGIGDGGPHDAGGPPGHADGPGPKAVARAFTVRVPFPPGPRRRLPFSYVSIFICVEVSDASHVQNSAIGLLLRSLLLALRVGSDVKEQNVQKTRKSFV